nr:chain-length determining protein [uncultured Brevundimonas sp.]
MFIAAPVYVSEARFVVRSQSSSSPNALGIALQTVGLSTSSSDAFMVHAYIKSRDAVGDVERHALLRALLPDSEGLSREDIFKKFQKNITIGYDSTNGISTLRVRSPSANTSQMVADTLLDGGEDLVNELNRRSSIQAISEAAETLRLTEAEVLSARTDVNQFRNRNRTIDPARLATESGQVLGALMTASAQARAEREQIASQAPNSPQLAPLDARIRAYQNQIDIERARTVSGPDALAPQVGAYEDLILKREMSEQALVAARASYEKASVDARRQRLYLDRVVDPNLPDMAILPRRGLSILLTFLSALLVYGIGALIWSGVREHRQV